MDLIGITFGDWTRLLAENRFAIGRSSAGRATRTTAGSVFNSIGRRREQAAYGRDIAATQVIKPVFIIGHWRSGTTLLHELLSLDDQFAAPTLFHASNPHTFLLRERYAEQALRDAEAQNRVMDNMAISFQSPGEDEFALAAMTLRSPLVSWSFPKQEAFYDRYLTFEDATPQERTRWQEALATFLRKITYRYQGRTVLLKSPPHTARIRMILDVFPDARFVHIHRDPFTVFRSTQRLYDTAVIPTSLQFRLNQEQVDTGILRRYRAMYDAFFAQQPLIPDGQYCEVRFQELTTDMVGQVECIYRQLGLLGFEQARPKLQAYAESHADYQRTAHRPLDETLRQRIATAWQRNFAAWGYEVEQT